MTKKNKRVDLDIRPYPNPVFKNYDYAGPEEADETSPGGGLYNGKMDKYKSVKEFLEKKRKARKKALSELTVTAGDVFDLKKKLEEKKEKDEGEKLKSDLISAVPAEIESPPVIDQLSQKREEKFLSEIKNETDVWMHRFSAVRKDDKGFFILKSDNYASSKMKVGQFLADVAMNMTPYWQISSIQNDRINLKPIAPNPFITGIGAGGAKITEQDISVFTGEYEKKKVNSINEKLEQGTATLDDIVYILEGSVPVNMGPNGSQGGWYNAEDKYSNRGGRKGMTPIQIMISDAEKIQSFGLPVPRKALDGTLDPSDWSHWIESNGSYVKYFPKNVDKYLDFSKRMTEKGRWRYSDDDLEEERRKYSVEAIEAYWDQVAQDFITLDREEYKSKHPYKPESLKEIAQWADSEIKKIIKQKENNYLTTAEDDTEESVLRSIFHPERRIAISNTVRLIEMAKEDPAYIKYLHDMIKLGGSDWFANEKVLDFFDLTDDIDGLKLAAEHLKDPTNLRYAISYLIQHGETDYVFEYLDKNPVNNFEALQSILYNLKDHTQNEEGRYQYIIDYIKNNNIMDKIKEVIVKKDLSNYYYADELIYTVLKAFGPNTLWQPGDAEMVAKLQNYMDLLKKK